MLKSYSYTTAGKSPVRGVSCAGGFLYEDDFKRKSKNAIAPSLAFNTFPGLNAFSIQLRSIYRVISRLRAGKLTRPAAGQSGAGDISRGERPPGNFSPVPRNRSPEVDLITVYMREKVRRKIAGNHGT